MKRRAHHKHKPIQFSFPASDPAHDLPHCAVCGGERINEFEIVGPDGLINMDVDGDLCLECAIHLWRALKEAYPLTYRQMAIELLRRYSVTRAAVQAAEIPAGPVQ